MPRIRGTSNRHFDPVSFIMDFENGELDHDQVIDGFQNLVDSGMVWSLQGSYGRTAQALIDRGDVIDSR